MVWWPAAHASCAVVVRPPCFGWASVSVALVLLLLLLLVVVFLLLPLSRRLVGVVVPTVLAALALAVVHVSGGTGLRGVATAHMLTAA